MKDCRKHDISVEPSGKTFEKDRRVCRRMHRHADVRICMPGYPQGTEFADVHVSQRQEQSSGQRRGNRIKSNLARSFEP
jgi:hypothetical protein